MKKCERRLENSLASVTAEAADARLQELDVCNAEIAKLERELNQANTPTLTMQDFDDLDFKSFDDDM